MSTDVLITDNRLGFSLSLADFLRVQGTLVCITADDTGKVIKNDPAIGPFVNWNRSSVFSLQSIPLQLKNIGADIETAVVVFDAPAYTQLYPESDILGADKIISELSLATIQMMYVLYSYFVKRQSGKLLFVHRDIPFAHGHIPIAAASGAFVRAAEELVIKLTKEEHALIQTMLVKLDGEENALYVEWLAAQIQQPVLSRTPGRWIKAGQRGFFGK